MRLRYQEEAFRDAAPQNYNLLGFLVKRDHASARLLSNFREGNNRLCAHLPEHQIEALGLGRGQRIAAGGEDRLEGGAVRLADCWKDALGVAG